MKRLVAIAVVAACAATTQLADAAGLTMDQAVAVALKRNRDVIASELDIEAVRLDGIAASVYPNPQFSYTLGNIILGSGNPQGLGLKPGPFDQPVQTFAISEVIDIWNKHGARVNAAEKNVELKRIQVEDALREIVKAVRTACADVLREQAERRLAHETSEHYTETVRLSRVRRDAGQISGADFTKIELEAMKHETEALEADQELDEAKAKLAALMGLPPSAAHDIELDETPPPRTPLTETDLMHRAWNERPDVRALHASRVWADASLSQARRDAFPDISLGVAYTHSAATISGDNPNALALTLSLPLPLFDRNQAAIGKANLELRKADNEEKKLALTVAHDVSDAVRHEAHARQLVDRYEGGMLARASESLQIAEKQFAAGSTSLLDLLEAQRTYIETRADYLKAVNGLWQARVDVAHSVGGPVR